MKRYSKKIFNLTLYRSKTVLNIFWRIKTCQVPGMHASSKKSANTVLCKCTSFIQWNIVSRYWNTTLVTLVTYHGGESAAAGSAWRGGPPASATASLAASPSLSAASVPDSATVPDTAWFPVVAASSAAGPTCHQDFSDTFLAVRSSRVVQAGRSHV